MEYFSLDAIQNITRANVESLSQTIKDYLEVQDIIEKAARNGEYECAYYCHSESVYYITGKLRELGFCAYSLEWKKSLPKKEGYILLGIDWMC